jgi:hypothetical protein
MGRERCLLAATGARVSVTRTIGTPPPHGTVVCFNFVYSRRLWKFDTDDSFLWEERESRAQKTDLVPPFFMRALLRTEPRKEAGFQREITEAR